MSSWRLAPGVIRLPQDRLAGGSPFRVLRLSTQGRHALARLLGSTRPPDPGSAQERLGERLVRAGLLVRPARPAVPVRDVTVVVPALSTAGRVRRLLDLVPAGVPVVVVDDGSHPPLADGLGGRPGLTVLRHASSRAPAAARNTGARATTTSWIAFVDTDVTPGGDWLGLLLAQADEDVVAVAPRVVSGHGGHGAAALVETWACALDLGATPADVGPGAPVSYVPTAMLLVRRAAFEAVGGFDEDLQVGEDVDLVWRLLRHGRVRYEPDLRASHEPRSSVASVLRRRFEYGTSAAALDRRHPGTLRHADVSLWSLVPWLVGLAVHPAAGLAAGAAATMAAPRLLPDLPATDARLLAARAHLRSAAGLGRYLARPLGPLTVLAMLLLPRRRRAIVGAVLVGTADLVRRWAERDRLAAPTATGAARVVAGSVLDDAAYSLGVWAGCVRERRFGPLLPRVRDVPGRRR